MTSLERFGFTPTESRVYQVLLRLGSSTGYAVSKAAGLARANTYQALDGLVRRSAARRSATIPARYAALAPDAVVGELDRSFRRDLEGLHQSLLALPHGATSGSWTLVPHDDWTGFTTGAALAVREAREEVLAVAGPWAAPLLDALTLAQQRGLAVRGMSLGPPPTAHPGLTVRDVPDAELRAYWSGRPVLVVVDRTQAWCGVEQSPGAGSGIETTHGSVVPFLRHLLRRELAAA